MLITKVEKPITVYLYQLASIKEVIYTSNSVTFGETLSDFKKFLDSRRDSNTVFLEEKINNLSDLDKNPSLKILINQPIFKKIVINNKKPTLLVINNNYYPNWQVKVNSKDKKILKVNLAFIGIYLEAGNNLIELSYKL